MKICFVKGNNEMIDTREKLQDCLETEEHLYREIGYKGRFHGWLTQCEVAKLRTYIKYLRYDEFYSNISGGFLQKMKSLYYRRKHNHLGWQLGISIPCNTFGKGLLVYHSQGIIVHRDARCGEFCKIHGNLCIGNNGMETEERNTPHIGSFVDFGVGSAVVGKVVLADRIKIGAGAVVCKDCEIEGAILTGIPAMIKM